MSPKMGTTDNSLSCGKYAPKTRFTAPHGLDYPTDTLQYNTQPNLHNSTGYLHSDVEYVESNL